MMEVLRKASLIVAIVWVLCWTLLALAAIVSAEELPAPRPIKPQPGLALKVRVSRIVDGDTLVVQTEHTAFQWKIRLISCWAPELKDKGGPESKDWVEAYLKKHSRDETLLHVPMPSKAKVNPLAHLSMERIPGFIWVGDDLLNAEIVKAGHATTTKEQR